MHLPFFSYPIFPVLKGLKILVRAIILDGGNLNDCLMNVLNILLLNILASLINRINIKIVTLEDSVKNKKNSYLLTKLQ